MQIIQALAVSIGRFGITGNLKYKLRDCLNVDLAKDQPVFVLVIIIVRPFTYDTVFHKKLVQYILYRTRLDDIVTTRTGLLKLLLSW
jgi:hypothetical protein